jgi:surface polysaccharide O-acyltransferase-like enzyme
MATTSPTPSARFVEIDSLKVAGILAVILIHSLRAFWDPRVSSAELWLGIVTRFAVPGFLFCSGFLYATTARITLPVVVKRLRRVLIPYLICSVGAQLWWVATGQAHPFAEVLDEILLGASFGPFYYVFLHFFLVLFAPLFALLPSSVLAALTTAMIVSQGWLESGAWTPLPIFWHIRDPLLWWGYFLLGWMIRLHHEPIRRWIGEHRGVLVAAFGLLILVCTGFASGDGQNEWVRVAGWLNIHASLGLVFVATCGRERTPGAVALLSDASYAIYLLHLFFVYGAERFVQPAVGEFDLVVIAIYWSAGLFGSLGVIGATRALLGARSRDVIGA